jgi:hypothetical protein
MAAILRLLHYGIVHHMLLLEERVLLADEALLRVSLRLEPLRYLLEWRAGAALVRYDNARGRHRRLARGRASGYEFRSVEQMRYDFEQDVKAAGDGLGEAP